MCVCLEIAQKEEAGLGEAEMLMQTKASLCVRVSVCLCVGV